MMIEAETRGARGFAARLTERAGRLAAAHAEGRHREGRADSSRWRRAALLWPLFNRDI